jgi:hypothetical protein
MAAGRSRGLGHDYGVSDARALGTVASAVAGIIGRQTLALRNTASRAIC